MAGLQAFDSSHVLLGLILLVLYVRPTHAFGAGNIASVSRIEGQNWRHGDIEDTLLTLLMSRASNKKFSKLDVKRVYFGNWLRDYSQAVDVGALKMVSADAIRLLLWILGFLSFGYGTREFEVTRDRLGCYRPEEHIDNPKDYADNEDARRYDPRLRGPVDERRELGIDERTGLKNYISNEGAGITTSAGLVRDLYRRCIDLAREARRSGNDDQLYEAFRLLGTANHCLEDFSAHSNYVELCLIEMGERDVFPHVGRRTQVQVPGARDRVWPCITGTFGGVDFLHSVCGEISDKATQSEIDELEGTISNAERNRQSASIIGSLLDKLPDGIIGGDEKNKVNNLQQNANTAQMQNMTITPKEPEEFARQAEMIRQQIYPVLEFHDNIMRSISETIDKIPILPDVLENLQEQLNVFVFSLIAPFVLPIIKQVKAELSTGSSEIISSSKRAQHIVFEDDNSSDPTHSMISKDHFSNVLNEPAGKVASQVLKWVVPQIVDCWDDERADVDRTINRIINGVFHHPALRDQGDDGARDGRQLMFRIVEGWWREQGRGQDELRDKLSRRGVEEGRNHKEGVQDKGHGCGKPLGMPNVGTASSTGAIGGVLGAGLLGGLNQATGGDRPSLSNQPSDRISQGMGKAAGDAVGGGLLGSIVGGVVGGVGGSLLGGAFNQGDEQKNSYKQEGYTQGGGHQQSYTETASKPSYGGGQQYGEATYQQTNYPDGGRREDYSRTEQYGGSTERREEHSYQSSGGYRQESHTEYSSGSRRHENKSDDDDEDDYAKKERKRREKEEKKREKDRRKQQGYGSEDSEDEDKHKRRSNEYGSRRNDSDDEKKYKRHSGGRRGSNEGRRQDEYGQEQSYGGGRQEYGQQQSYGGGRSEQQEYGQQQSYGGGRSERQEYGQSGHGGGREESSSYGQSGYGGGREESSSYGQSGYGVGREDSSSYGRSGYGAGRDDGGYGAGRSSEYQQEGGYGRSEGYGGGRRDDDESEGYGRRRRDNEGESYGGGGGYRSGGYGGGY